MEQLQHCFAVGAELALSLSMQVVLSGLYQASELLSVSCWRTAASELWRPAFPPASPQQLLLIKSSSSPPSLCPSIPLSSPAQAANIMTSSSLACSSLVLLAFFFFSVISKCLKRTKALTAFEQLSGPGATQNKHWREVHKPLSFMGDNGSWGWDWEHDSSIQELYTPKTKMQIYFPLFLSTHAELNILSSSRCGSLQRVPKPCLQSI